MIGLILLITMIKWSNGMIYHESTQMPSNSLNDELAFELNDAIGNNETTIAFDNNNTEKYIDKRSTVATAAVAAATPTKLDTDNGYTYLNIGVLMASHLGKYTQKKATKKEKSKPQDKICCIYWLRYNLQCDESLCYLLPHTYIEIL